MDLSYEDIEVTGINIELLILCLCSKPIYDSENTICIPKTTVSFEHHTKSVCEELLRKKVFDKYEINESTYMIRLYWVDCNIVDNLLENKTLRLSDWLDANWSSKQRILYHIIDCICKKQENLELNILWFFLFILGYLEEKKYIKVTSIIKKEIDYGKGGIRAYVESGTPLRVKYQPLWKRINKQEIFKLIKGSSPKEFAIKILRNKQPTGDLVSYNIQTYLFYNSQNSLSYTVTNTYTTFLKILLQHQWQRMPHKNIEKQLNHGAQATVSLEDWLLKRNLLKNLRDNSILQSNEDIIISQDKHHYIPH